MKKKNSAEKQIAKKVLKKKTTVNKTTANKSGGRLGRGLSALFDEEEASSSLASNEMAVEADTSGLQKKAELVAGEQLLLLDIEEVKAGALQARTHFDPEKIKELAASVKRHGIIEPLLVRKSVTGGYEIVAGERRYRAARQLGLKKVPAILRVDSAELSHEVMLVENLQREDLSASEEAEGLARMMKLNNLTQIEVAEKLGKSRSYVANALRLLKLPRWILTKIEIGELSAGVARALVGLSEEDLQVAIARIEKENLNARDVEKLAASYKGSFVKESDKKKSLTNFGERKKSLTNSALRDADLLLMEDQLRDAVKSKVKLHEIRGGVGKIEIEYYSYEELDDFLKKLH